MTVAFKNLNQIKNIYDNYMKNIQESEHKVFINKRFLYIKKVPR